MRSVSTQKRPQVGGLSLYLPSPNSTRTTEWGFGDSPESEPGADQIALSLPVGAVISWRMRRDVTDGARGERAAEAEDELRLGRARRRQQRRPDDTSALVFLNQRDRWTVKRRVKEFNFCKTVSVFLSAAALPLMMKSFQIYPQIHTFIDNFLVMFENNSSDYEGERSDLVCFWPLGGIKPMLPEHQTPVNLMWAA